MPLPLPTMSYLSDIYFQRGGVALVRELVDTHGITRPLIVTDAGLVQFGLVGRLGLGDAPVFDDVVTNPTEASAHAGLAAFRAGRCDGIVALGGGSPLDLAKIIALMVHHEGPLADYAILAGGIGRITDRVPPMIAAPTTAGSGSEVGRAALVTLDDGRKMGFLSRHFLPRAAVLDAELTASMPPGLTAGTGMDAVSHCIETFCSTKLNPVADAIALDGLARGWGAIGAAFADGADLDARDQMLLCSLAGGLAFQKSLGAVHSLSHPLGALTERRLHHGTLNALFLPHVLRFNMEACANKLDRLAEVVGAPGRAALPDAVSELIASLGLPARLSEMGLAWEDVEPLSAAAAGDHCSPTNPRPLSVDDCRDLYRAAM